MQSGPVNPRRYDNSSRAEQARRTGRRVLDVAHRLLLERGYAGTAIADVAAGAGVSVETIYKRFGGKGALIKAVYDVRLAGDDDPVPIGQRPEALALVAEPDPRRKLGLYAALSRQLAERAGPLVAVLIQARGAEPDLDRFASTVEAERLAGATALVTHLSECGGLRAGLSVESARDILWTLISPEVYQLLVARRGWSPEDYQEWLGDAMAHALL